jgi:hypothetical protein
MADNKQDKLKDWLQNLARESWQLELLVSAFTIFLLVQASDSFSEFIRSMPFRYNIQDAFLALGFVFMAILGVSLRILTFSLITHLLMRGFWIGAIGLRSVQPDIDFRDFNYSEFFRQKLENKVMKLDDLVVRLDEICSVIFAFSFLLISLLISIALFIVTAGVIAIIGQYMASLGGPVFASVAEVISNILAFLYMIGGLIYAIDYISLGFFKKFRVLSKIYYPFYFFFSLITLSFISRSIYYHMIRKFSKRNIRLIYLLVLGLLIGFVAIDYDQYQYYSDTSDEHVVRGNMFDDMRSEKAYIQKISVPSMKAEGPFVPLFVRYLPSDNAIISSACPEIIPPKKDGFNFGLTIRTQQRGIEVIDEELAKGNDVELLHCLAKIHEILINGKPMEYPKYYYHRHAGTGQAGLLYIIPQEKLTTGENLLTVKKRIDPSSAEFTHFASLTLWK